MSAFAELLERRVLVCDGAMGTMLHAAGNSLHRSLPELNLSNPDLVSTVHESYVDAGADILLTNTFGASRIRLDNAGLADRVAELNVAAVTLARAAADKSDRRVFVAGSISPAVGASQRAQVHPQQRLDAIAEQVKALHDGGVDVLAFETFGYLDELIEAIAIAAEFSDIPIIAQATFSTDGLTLGGETPMVVASRLSELPIAALGVNCTVGPQQMQSILEQLSRHSRVPLSVQPNAGLPRRVAGGRFEYIIDDGYFARYARRYVTTGAAIVGGCCGTTPNHIRAAVAAIADLRNRPRRRLASAMPPVLEQRESLESAARPTGLPGRLAQGQFSVVAQINADSIAELDGSADFIESARSSGVDLFHIADQPSARARADALSVALNLQYRCGIDPVATATTWDKTIMTLQAALLGVHALGLRTVVCETGNPPIRGEYPNADGVWEVDSIGMIGLLAALNQGRDFSGLALGTETAFHIGARFNPGAVDLEEEIARTRAKIRAGAQFLISRPVHELDRVRLVLAELADECVPALVTVLALSSFEQAEFLAHEVPDVLIPPATLAAMKQSGTDPVATGVALAKELVAGVRDLAQGVVLGGVDSAGLAGLVSAL